MTGSDSFQLANSVRLEISLYKPKVRRSAKRNHPQSENPDHSSYSLHGFRVISITHEAKRKFLTMNSSRRKILTRAADTQEYNFHNYSRRETY